MNAKIEFDKSLRLSKIILMLSGINMYQSKRNRIAEYFARSLFYWNLLWLYTDVLGEFYWLIEGIQIGKSFGELTMIAPCATICLLATAKSAPLYVNRKLLVNVVDTFRDIQPDINIGADEEPGSDNAELVKITDDKRSARVERNIVRDSTKLLNIIIQLLFYTDSVVVLVFSCLPLMVMGYNYYTKGESELLLPFLIKYFFDPFTKSTWPLVYIHQVWSTFIAAFNVFGVDTFFYAFCTYFQMHFRILCHRFEFVVTRSSAETKDKLLELLKRHQLLIDLVNKVELIYSKSILFNIVTSSVLICLSGFNVTILEDRGVVFAFVTFLIMSTSQIFLLCLFGDMLMTSSLELRQAVYNSRWYDVDNSTKKSILLILIRVQKPCKLTAAKFADLHLSAFTTILSRSWSYFALLQTMYK